ncbi:type III PLP-dependent enzyme [Alisedimentitalea sp. MJ-SS2]|uniref:type III PLP-dependent enzyme n=1 Tax=Aliisedimentitalea sp. MJ-SS2 TaxID=3049795 RepID=UPI00291179CA|nr:type III PLP-dependent enzyme [Alisedimentitalea sp. MJ-SS2]MDU8928421.1 type III PLP-dependent enzyme [Alisedimentitalea sp. MJ-SS2]
MFSSNPIVDPRPHLRRNRPDAVVMYFDPATLQATAKRFQAGFAGLVTYAVKANATPVVLENLAAAGIRAFDVASPREMDLVAAAAPGAKMHYNNPVRSRAEVAKGIAAGVVSWSVDGLGELEKLGKPRFAGEEVAVRLALPVKGASYDFGAKFGETPDGCVDLLQEVERRGFTPAMTFHPGTQCADPNAWGEYIRVCAAVAHRAGVRLARLNVGGGFAAHRFGAAPDLEAIFATIAAETRAAFGDQAPKLVCEPGRAMVAESFVLATRVKALREDGAVFLNDGIYGALSELRDIGPTDRVLVVSPEGQDRRGALMPRMIFGPTCDSLDCLPAPVALPKDIREEDYVLFSGMGAYSLAIATAFNGYGPAQVVTLLGGPEKKAGAA